MAESDFTPDPQHLAALRAVEKRYGLQRATQLLPTCESDRHRLETGHRLSYGCCADRSAGQTNSR